MRSLVRPEPAAILQKRPSTVPDRGGFSTSAPIAAADSHFDVESKRTVCALDDVESEPKCLGEPNVESVVDRKHDDDDVVSATTNGLGACSSDEYVHSVRCDAAGVRHADSRNDEPANGRTAAVDFDHGATEWNDDDSARHCGGRGASEFDDSANEGPANDDSAISGGWTHGELWNDEPANDGQTGNVGIAERTANPILRTVFTMKKKERERETLYASRWQRERR